MTDQALLEQAQRDLDISRRPGILTDQASSASLASLAASLLVIARNSDPLRNHKSDKTEGVE